MLINGGNTILVYFKDFAHKVWRMIKICTFNLGLKITTKRLTETLKVNEKEKKRESNSSHLEQETFRRGWLPSIEALLD